MAFNGRILSLAAGLALALAAPASAQQMPKVVLAMSGWTGFAPLTSAEKEGLFKKHGVDVEIKFIAQKERHLAMAAGQVQAIATTIDTQVSYTAAGVPLTQILLLDKSNGGDGIVVRAPIQSLAGSQGQDHRRRRRRHDAVFHNGLHAQAERHEPQGSDAGHAGAAAGRPGLRRRPVRCGCYV